MSLFTQRIDRATKRFMDRVGRVSFRWKADGPTYSGDLGERSKGVNAHKNQRGTVLEVRKVEMPEEPVPGRELTILPATKWEVESIEHDEVTWTIRLVQPKKP